MLSHQQPCPQTFPWGFCVPPIVGTLSHPLLRPLASPSALSCLMERLLQNSHALIFFLGGGGK